MGTYTPLSRPPTANTTPSVGGEGYDLGRDREASLVSSCTDSRGGKSESRGVGVEVAASEADDNEL